MKLARRNRIRSLVKGAVIASAVIAAMFLATPGIRGRQKQDDKNKPAEKQAEAKKQPETKKPEAAKAQEPQKTSEAKKRPGLFDNVKGTFDIGGRFRSVKGDKPGKFEEYRDVPQAFSSATST